MMLRLRKVKGTDKKEEKIIIGGESYQTTGCFVS
jgi:hypothetical protein